MGIIFCLIIHYKCVQLSSILHLTHYIIDHLIIFMGVNTNHRSIYKVLYICPFEPVHDVYINDRFQHDTLYINA